MKPPLCGNATEHEYYARARQTCPLCARIKHDEAEKQDRLDFAAMIADAVVERLKEIKK